MTANQAKAMIKANFLYLFGEWLDDVENLSDNDFSWKYGWGRTDRTKAYKDNLNGITAFQKYFYPMRTTEQFEEMGIDKKIIWQLASEKWLSVTYGYYKTSTRYFISQQRAKEIWKEDKFVNGARE